MGKLRRYVGVNVNCTVREQSQAQIPKKGNLAGTTMSCQEGVRRVSASVFTGIVGHLLGELIERCPQIWFIRILCICVRGAT